MAAVASSALLPHRGSEGQAGIRRLVVKVRGRCTEGDLAEVGAEGAGQEGWSAP